MLDYTCRDTVVIALRKFLRHQRPTTKREVQENAFTGGPCHKDSLAVLIVHREPKLRAALPVSKDSRLGVLDFVFPFATHGVIVQVQRKVSPTRRRSQPIWNRDSSLGSVHTVVGRGFIGGTR